MSSDDPAMAASELARMRRRWLLAAAHERSRIERDLHDGAQQQLIALRIKLRLLENDAEAIENPVARDLAVLGGDLERAIEELRAIAHRLYRRCCASRVSSGRSRTSPTRSP